MSQAQLSFELQSAQGSGTDGKPRRSVFAKEQLVSSMPSGVKTMFENFKAGVGKNGPGNCLGRRIMSSDPQHPYLWESYSRVLERTLNFGSGLQGFGMPKGSVVGILCMPCPEWVITEQACYGYGLISVPMFDNLKPSSIEQIIAETQMKVLITTIDKLEMLLLSRAKFEKLEAIILIDSIKETDKERGKTVDLTVAGFLEVEEKGKASPVEPTPSEGNDVITIVYTAGTSGISKRVELTNHNFLAVLGSLESLGNHGAFVKLSKDDVYLAYLPLAHLSERVMMNLALGEGAEIGFFQGDFSKFFEDVSVLRPTILSSVPEVLDNLYEAVVSGVEESGRLSLAFFNMAVKGKMKNLRIGKLEHFIYDKLAFKRVHNMFGDRVRALLAGTAPMAHDVVDFFRLALGCQIYQMYGLTEVTAFGSLTTLGDYEQGHVGAPLPCNEVKLITCNELKFAPTDLPYPRGEICFRGANVFKQYFKSDADAPSALDSDGWFHSGDLGSFDNRGRLKIIGRKDHIINLRAGELIVPEVVEAVYRRSKWVAWCYADADTTKSYMLAIVVPEESVLTAFAKDHKLPGENSTEWIKNPKVKDAISKDLAKISSKCLLQPGERVRDFALDTTNFSIENDLLTPEFYLVRPRVRSYYAALLAELSTATASTPPTATTSATTSATPSATTQPTAPATTMANTPATTAITSTTAPAVIPAAVIPTAVISATAPAAGTTSPLPKPEEAEQKAEVEPLRVQSQPLPATSKLPTSAEPADLAASAPTATTSTQEESTLEMTEVEKELQATIAARMQSEEGELREEAAKESKAEEQESDTWAKKAEPLTVSTTTTTEITEGQPQAQSSLSPVSG